MNVASPFRAAHAGLKPGATSEIRTLPQGQGSVKVDWVERDPSPTALRSPLSPRERAAIFDFLSLSGGRGGTARRWVRGLFADDAFVALYVCGTLDFDGALASI